jgi:hypothetical protein
MENLQLLAPQRVEQTPQQAKEYKINALHMKIKNKLNYMYSKYGDLSVKYETSSCAPAYGWSVEEYNYMPIVADRLRDERMTISSSVNYGVTDWLISQ